MPINHRASHARSCAVHVAQKYKVKRSEIIVMVKKKCSVDLMTANTDEQITSAVEVLNYLRIHGLDA